jgi:hypothetical protein
MREKLSRPWLTLGVRLSVFPAAPQEAPADLWEKVVGAPPESDQNQPRQHQRIQSGPWEGGVLQLTYATASPPRIVWLAVPSANEAGLPDLDVWPVVSALPKFLAITRSWLTSVEFEINRIGFGLHSLLAAEDKASAYRLLQPLIPNVPIDPETTSDFLYQINRTTPSRVLRNNVRLNRLMKWSALFFGMAQFQVMAAELAQTGPLLGKHFTSLDNDVNTPAEYRLGRLDKEQLGAIYDELVDLAWENLEVGEK